MMTENGNIILKFKNVAGVVISYDDFYEG